MKDPTKRFSDRVDNYIKYRPGYPQELIHLLQSKCELNAGSIIADIGSGTGILTVLFLSNGYPVFAVEPNREMREAAERLLNRYEHFESIDGAAEATMLDDQSVDLITAGQAFHWFDRQKAKIEFQRILKPDGWIAIIWNERLTDSTPFLKKYEHLLKEYAPEYSVVDHRKVVSGVLNEFFAPSSYQTFTFPNHQDFDYEGLKGRLLSSSYVPNLGDKNLDPMLDRLKGIFDQHHSKGKVRFDYIAKVFYGQMRK